MVDILSSPRCVEVSQGTSCVSGTMCLNPKSADNAGMHFADIRVVFDRREVGTKFASLRSWRIWCQLHVVPILYMLLQVTLQRSETVRENGIYRQTRTLLHCKIISYMWNKRFYCNNVTLASNHKKLYCFLNSLLRLSSKKTPKLHSL